MVRTIGSSKSATAPFHSEQCVAVLAPLALLDAQEHPFTVDVGDLQLHHLADPQAGRIGRHQQGAVATVLGGGEQARHVLAAEHVGLSLRLLRRGNEELPAPAVEGHLIEKPQSRDDRRETAQGELALLPQIAQVAFHRIEPQGVRGAARVAGQSLHAAQVGPAGVLAEAADHQILLHLGA
jgi:hypothetical protein